MNWDDLSVVLAVQRCGTLSGAARQLGMDQTTVSRRLKGLEDELGFALFIRKRPGLAATEATETALAELEVMEAAAARFADALGSSFGATHGQVRIAATPWIFNHLLVPNLESFYKKNPQVRLNFIADVRERSLSDREAELALRFEMKTQGEEIEIDFVTVPYSVFARCDRLNSSLPWIGSEIDFETYEPQKWLEKSVGANFDQLPLRSNDAGILYNAARIGLGKCLLPNILGVQAPELENISGKHPVLERSLRILVHPTVKSFLRVTAVIDWLVEIIPQFLEEAETL